MIYDKEFFYVERKDVPVEGDCSAMIVEVPQSDKGGIAARVVPTTDWNKSYDIKTAKPAELFDVAEDGQIKNPKSFWVDNICKLKVYYLGRGRSGSNSPYVRMAHYI